VIVWGATRFHAKMAGDEGRVELSPEKFLTFNWEKPSDAPVALLHANNTSPTSYIAYKVKTTAPKRYVVKPPQGCIEPGQVAVIKLTMVGKDANALWAEALDSGGEVKSDDKFLVQTCLVSSKFYFEELADQDDKAQSGALQKLWKTLAEEDKKEKEKKQIKSAKLTTNFVFPNNMSAISGTADLPQASQAPPSRMQQASPSDGGPPDSATAAIQAHSVGESASSTSVPGSPEQVFSELAALRKKYDDLVAYTVVLTGERDFLQQDCEEKTNELRGLQAEVAKAGAKGGGSATAEQVKQVAENATGFAFLHVLIVGLVAFVFGRFFG